MRHVFERGGLTIGPTVAWATREWSPEEAYERSEYNNAKPIIDDDEEETEEDESEEEGEE